MTGLFGINQGEKKIKIMIINNIEWSMGNASGNTLANWFDGMTCIKLSNIYRRSSLPDNNVCASYFRITTQSIISNFFHPDKIGKEFHIDQNMRMATVSGKKEKIIINLIHKLNVGLVYKIDDLIFATKKWDNSNFKSYVQKESPDIVFSFLKDFAHLELLLDAIVRYVPKCKRVFVVADDVYFRASRRNKERFRKLLRSADYVYGMSESLCENYRDKFNIDVHPLYKGCRFKDMVETKQENPIEIVYAGNLYYGRDDTLAKIVLAVKEYNSKNNRKLHLNIYSGTRVKRAFRELFDDKQNVTFHGQKPFNEIQGALSKASVVLHVESFDEKWKKIVRFSYSTKIIDCLECGSVLMVVGPKGVASVEETRRIPGVFVADDLDLIYDQMVQISKSDIQELARLTRKYAENHCSIATVQDQLIRDFAFLCGAHV